MKKKIIEQIEEWKEELQTIKCGLIEAGDRPDSLAYNVESAKALKLSECITDATELLIDYT